MIFLQSQARVIEIIEEVINSRKKNVSQLVRHDFHNTPLAENLVHQIDFNTQIGDLFFSYAVKRYNNEINYFRQEQKRKTGNAISDVEFVKKYPKPWETVNNILSSHSIKYRVPAIPDDEEILDYRYHFYLINTITGKSVLYEDLSSGEQVIMGLILKLFLSDQYRANLKFPDLLLLDEPDAFLHPEMSKLLIDVLKRSFVDVNNIKVIMTTHSPSTIALTPDECIYEIKNEPETTLKKIEKDVALKLLTGNIPTLSIDYKNHRQIFVESDTDEYFYRHYFEKLYTLEKTTHQLYFIPSGTRKGLGNCDQAKGIVKALREAGNASTYALIDWDEKYKTLHSEYTYVHGENRRYSIENYLLDPLYLIVLFCQNNLAHGVSALGFSNTYDEYSIRNESNERLQECANWISGKFCEKFPANKLEESIENDKWEYLNGKYIIVPKWYSSMQGHELQTKLGQVFPILQSEKYRSEGHLQRALTNIIIKCSPLIPKDTAEVLRVLST